MWSGVELKKKERKDMRDDGKEKEMKAEGSETKREMAYETWGMKSIVWREKKGTSEIKEVDGNEKQKKRGGEEEGDVSVNEKRQESWVKGRDWRGGVH